MVGVDQVIDEQPVFGWCVIGASVRGASHERSDQVNQDAIRWFPESCDEFPLIIAVSDGHGGARYFRSDRGARFAVEAAIGTLCRFQENPAAFLTSSMMELEERLSKSLVNTWRSKVESRLQEEPFTPDELAFIEEREGEAAKENIVAKPVQAYGATILAAMITENCITYLQLGDGDILAVSEQGEVSKVFPTDKRHFANETTSLCGNDPWRDFQFRRERLSPTTALILLSTDGYKNSFSSDEGFYKVGTDILEMLRDGKAEEVKSSLPHWLTEATQVGSGDDITLGVLYRIDVCKGTAVPQPIIYGQEQEEREGVEDQQQEKPQEQVNYMEVEHLEHDTESSHCDESLQSQQASIWDALRGAARGTMDG
jgi:serine/threonine protein phosphatase PrpC